MPPQPPVLVARAQSASKRFHLGRIFRSSSNGQPRRFLQMAFEDRARYERDSGVVPALRSGLAQAPAQMRRGLRGRVRREDPEGRRILSVNRNDNLAIDPLRETVSPV